ncbi:MAG: M23 family metallopeptidase [Actinomycetota bacterium]
MTVGADEPVPVDGEGTGANQPRGEQGVAGAATASAPAERERLTGRIAFPVAEFGPGELVCLNNFGGRSTARGVCGHRGVDIGVDVGGLAPHPLVACVDGVIESIGSTGSSGRYVILFGDDGRWYRYHHLSAYADGLDEGLRVAVGDTLGLMGTSGNTSWRHLHFEVWVDSVIPRDGIALDPVPLMPIPGAVRLAAASGCGG